MPRAARTRAPVGVHVLRLLPGEDLRATLEDYAKTRGLRAAFVVTAVGSLTGARLRPAGKDTPLDVPGDLEIISLGGTLAVDGTVHLHLGVADATGKMTGGHLLHGCPVRTTAEIILGEPGGLTFRRLPDPQTGFAELVWDGPNDPS